MLIDGRTVPSGQTLEPDLCIIGGGAAGITLAREFIAQPVQVCLLESGGLEYDHEVQELYRGDNVGLPYDMYGTRLRFLGGATNHWGGYCRPLEDIAFEARPWVRFSGWPIGRAQLDPFLAGAAERCEIGPLQPRAAAWAERFDLPLMAWNEGSGIENVAFQVSPPTRFGEVYRPELIGAGNIDLYVHSNVTAIRAAPDAGSVTALEVRTLAGNAFEVKAKVYVLACGGIENARLLLLSRDVEPAGLGNRHDLVGRFFMEHAHFDLGRLLLAEGAPDPRFYLHELPSGTGAARINAHIGFSEAVQREHEIAAPMIQLRPRIPSLGEQSLLRIIGALKLGDLPDDLGRHLGQVLSDFGAISGLVGQKVARRLFGDQPSSELALRSVGEQVPNPDSRVTLADETDALGLARARLDWRLTELDQLTMDRGGELFAAAVGQAGLGRVQLYREQDAATEPTFIEGGYHHMGTTRMSDDPRQGVVDRDCRLHGTGNLYVAGSSVFPTAGGGTPTLTIVALALRLAEHLKSNVFV